MDRLLEGKTALVTGASKGVGKGIALEFARQGCQVAVNYNSDAAGAAGTVKEIEALGGSAFAAQANVGDSKEMSAMFDLVMAKFPKLDILVNNAGVQTWCSLLDLSEAEWDRVLDTNLKGCFLGTQRAARHMKDSGGGSIINIGSGCNKIAFPKLVNYTASKGGIEQLTKVAAVELGPYAIRVNCVAPGAIEIERTKTEEAGASYGKTWGELTPLNRVGLPVDVARTCVFFACDLSAFVTGQTLWVDGGLFSMPQWPYDRNA
jgi:NAD(P)-dependent dehydrogenase (short-subunit alcohol dehydrogenase family)